MIIHRSTDAATEPVTRAEMETQLRISTDYEGAATDSIISAARQQVELDTDLALITQTWTLTLDKWPKKTEIVLPKGLTIGITSFAYLNTSNVSTALVVDTDYYLSNTGKDARLIPVSSWPSVTTEKNEAITVVYMAGFGAAAAVPENFKTAIKARGSDLHEGREDFSKIYKSIVSMEKHYFNYSIND